MLKIDRIAQIAIRVHNVDRAVAFYRDILELRFLFRAGNLAFFDCGGVRILLDKPDDAEFDHPSSVIYFNVADIQSAFATLTERKVETIRQPHVIARLGNRDVWMAFFRDPDRNVLSLTSEVPA
jgi:catechol 2,3-dioxygenase-like lactoylglutathione lyase family enzyme